jgi:hypothetical protein
MQCQWHCMHRACGVIDTACILHVFCIVSPFYIWISLFEVLKFYCAFSVNDIDIFKYKFEFAKLFDIFDMHTVSLTPQAQCMQCLWHRMKGVIDLACTSKISNSNSKPLNQIFLWKNRGSKISQFCPFNREPEGQQERVTGGSRVDAGISINIRSSY